MKFFKMCEVLSIYFWFLYCDVLYISNFRQLKPLFSFFFLPFFSFSPLVVTINIQFLFFLKLRLFFAKILSVTAQCKNRFFRLFLMYKNHFFFFYKSSSYKKLMKITGLKFFQRNEQSNILFQSNCSIFNIFKNFV